MGKLIVKVVICHHQMTNIELKQVLSKAIIADNTSYKRIQERLYMFLHVQ